MIHSTNPFALPTSSPPARVSASDLERRVEKWMRILADLDRALATEVAKLSRLVNDEEPAPVWIEALKEARRQRREPYVQGLAALHARSAGRAAVPQDRSAIPTSESWVGR